MRAIFGRVAQAAILDPFFLLFSDAAPHASRDKKKKKASLCPVADDSSGLTAFDKFTRDLASAMAIARL